MDRARRRGGCRRSQSAEEFADRQPHTKHELQAKLAAVVTEASAVLQALPPSRLLERRHIQTFDTTLLTAVFETVSHFVGHTHQVVYITRLRLGDKYVFQWVPPPASKASGSSEE